MLEAVGLSSWGRGGEVLRYGPILDSIDGWLQGRSVSLTRSEHISSDQRLVRSRGAAGPAGIACLSCTM
jgi:hypothetical protein